MSLPKCHICIDIPVFSRSKKAHAKWMCTRLRNCASAPDSEMWVCSRNVFDRYLFEVADTKVNTNFIIIYCVALLLKWNLFFCRRWSQQNANSFFPIRWMYIFLQLVLKFCERLCKTKLIVANFPLKKKLYYKSFNWIMCAIMKWSNTKLATLNFIEIGFR